MTIPITIGTRKATIELTPEVIEAIAVRVAGLKARGLNLNELAKALGSSRKHLSHLAAVHKLPHRRFGKRYEFYLDEVEEALRGGTK